MKLNTLRAIGINLTIEDLFDDGGFSLIGVNEALLGTHAREDSFSEGEGEGEGEGKGGGGRAEELTDAELEELLRGKVGM